MKYILYYVLVLFIVGIATITGGIVLVVGANSFLISITRWGVGIVLFLGGILLVVVCLGGVFMEVVALISKRRHPEQWIN